VSDAIRTSSKWSDKEEDVRKRLRGYRALVSNHAACQALYDTLYPRMTQRFSNEPRTGQIEMFEIESVVNQRMELSAIMGKSLQAMRDEIGDILRMVNGLPPDEGAILLYRYTMAESWEKIGAHMNYCESHVRRKHDRAITRIVQNMSRNEQS